MEPPILDFYKNDFVQNIVVYAYKNGKSHYFFSDKEYWILVYWNGYVDIPNGSTLEDEYFNFITPFIVALDELEKESKRLYVLGDTEKIEANKPKLFVDFDKKIFLSMYYDQALENRLIEGWTGKYTDFLNLIPPNDRYWEVDTNT
jgi:hypothetical protein